MAVGESSFDVVSQFNRQELVNAVDQALREVHTRYDLKDSGTTIELEASALKLHSASEMTLEAVRVTGKSKDELQAAIQLLRKMEVDREWPVPLQFVNYR